MGAYLGARLYTSIPLLAVMRCNLGSSAETSAPALGTEINEAIHVNGRRLVLGPLSDAGQGPYTRPTRHLGRLGGY